jgi:hypothetical protein
MSQVAKFKPLRNGGDLNQCARGGLEPHFRVLFSAIFHGVSSGISIRVENGGFSRTQNCCKVMQVYVHCLF